MNLKNIILPIISIIMYFYAPLEYSRSFCIVCLIIFLLCSLPSVIEDSRKINILNFNLLFSLSFFFCTYVYPVFLIGRTSVIGSILSASLTTLDTVNRCVALSTMAISFYFWAYKSFRNKTKIEIQYEEFKTAAAVRKMAKLLVMIVFLFMFYAVYIFSKTTHEISFEINDSPYLFQLFYLLLPLYLVVSAIDIIYANPKLKTLAFVKRNWNIVILLVLLMALFVIIGDRAPILTIAFSLLATITLYIKKISPKILLIISVTGIVLMFALRVTRTGSSALNSGDIQSFVTTSRTSIIENTSPWDIMSDLVGINFELNTGMDYVDRHGHIDAVATTLIYSVSPLPFAPTLIAKGLYGKMPSDFASGVIIANYTDTNAGNHCVIDLYMPYGAIGVIVVFFIFGMLVSKITNKLNNNLFCKIFYVYLIGSAVFMARNSIVNIYRAITLSYFLYFIMTMLFVRKRKAALSD